MAAATKLAQVSEPRRALLSVEEVAELLQVPVSWVYDRTGSRGVNRIPGFRLGKYWRFEEREVLAWGGSNAEAAEVLNRGTLSSDTGNGGRATERSTMARPRYQNGHLVIRGKRRKRYVIRWREDVAKPDGTIDRIRRAETIGFCQHHEKAGSARDSPVSGGSGKVSNSASRK